MAGAYSVFAREDTMFGACYALGEDFGFNPTYLRIVFAGLFFWSPPAAAGVYAACLAVVLVSRCIVPDPPRIDPEVADWDADRPSNEDERQEELPLAA